MDGWHHRLDEHEFEQVPGAGDGQWSLACCSQWVHKDSDMTEWLNWTELRQKEIKREGNNQSRILFGISRPDVTVLYIEGIQVES